MRFVIAGLLRIACGVLYLQRPTLYRRGLWLKTSLAVRLLEASYKRHISNSPTGTVLAPGFDGKQHVT
jgi:hypothetical protein